MIVRISEGGSVEPITIQAHDWWFRQWMRNLTPAEYQAIVDALNQHINTTGKAEIITTSWIPGSDWTGTPYEPIYLSVGQDWQSARFFYGLIVWQVMMNERREAWSFGRYPRSPGEIIGLTYFRVHLPAADAA